jgi:hypothetical protein
METACTWFGSGVALGEAVALSLVLTFGIGVIASTYSAAGREMIVDLAADEGEGEQGLRVTGAVAT